MLSALRAAHTARLALLQGAPEAAEQVLHHAKSRPEDHYPPMRVQGSFSACGHYCAVSYQRPSLRLGASGVVIFQAAGELKEIASFKYRGAHPPAFRWAPAASQPHLSIALPGVPYDEPGSSTQHPAVLVFDARAGLCLHGLGPSGDSLFRSLCRAEAEYRFMWPQLEWSASGELLLVSSRADGDNCDFTCPERGVLSVYNIRQERIVAQSPFCIGATMRGSTMEDEVLTECMLAARWHPSSCCLLLSSEILLQAPEAFTHVGLVVGTLPEHCYLSCAPGLGWSPDGQRLLVHKTVIKLTQPAPSSPASSRGSSPSQEDSFKVFGRAILRVTLAEQQIVMAVELDFLGSCTCVWLPCSPRLEKQDWALCDAGLMDLTDQQCLVVHEDRFSVSPSQLFMAHSCRSPQILSLESGKQLWAGPKAGMASGWVQFLPSGCGVVSVITVFDEREPQLEIRITTFA